jgi:hypothetical protein
MGLFKLKTGEIVGMAQGLLGMTKDYICPICGKKFYIKKYRNDAHMIVAIGCHMQITHPEVEECGFNGIFEHINAFRCSRGKRSK